jgi:large subunit ribosomal protein L22
MNETKKIISATSKYLRISPSKVDLILCKIRGKSYKEALQILKFLPQKAGAIVWQTL